MIYILMILIGVIAGLRAMIPLAAISWAAFFGWIDVSDTWLGFIAHIVTALVLTLLALGELATDQLPQAPSRKIPLQFGARIVTGALVGALLPGTWVVGLILGATGAIIGTLVGAELRNRLAIAFGRDLPGAIAEDAVAIFGSLLVVYLAR